MKKIRKLIARLYDLPNAFRVLDIMDNCGCDVFEVNRDGLPSGKYWSISTKWYVSKQDADDLRTIVLYKRQYKRRSGIWKKVFFREFREGCRVLHSWFGGTK